MRTFLAVLALFVGILPVVGQTPEVLSLEIKRGEPGKIYPRAGFTIEVWVNDQQGSFLRGFQDGTYIEFVKDSEGNDILMKHSQAVSAWRATKDSLQKQGRFAMTSRSPNPLPFDRMGSLFDTTGFTFTIDSWALPDSGTSYLHCKGEVGYLLKNTVMDSVRIDVENLNRDRKLTIDGEVVELVDQGSYGNSEGRFLMFGSGSDAITLRGARILNMPLEDGAPKYRTRIGDQFMEIPEELADEPMEMILYFSEPLKKVIPFDFKVGLGL